jgi:hypothetical protein
MASLIDSFEQLFPMTLKGKATTPELDGMFPHQKAVLGALETGLDVTIKKYRNARVTSTVLFYLVNTILNNPRTKVTVVSLSKPEDILKIAYTILDKLSKRFSLERSSHRFELDNGSSFKVVHKSNTRGLSYSDILFVDDITHMRDIEYNVMQLQWKGKAQVIISGDGCQISDNPYFFEKVARMSKDAPDNEILLDLQWFNDPLLVKDLKWVNLYQFNKGIFQEVEYNPTGKTYIDTMRDNVIPLSPKYQDRIAQSDLRKVNMEINGLFLDGDEITSYKSRLFDY